MFESRARSIYRETQPLCQPIPLDVRLCRLADAGGAVPRLRLFLQKRTDAFQVKEGRQLVCYGHRSAIYKSGD